MTMTMTRIVSRNTARAASTVTTALVSSLNNSNNNPTNSNGFLVSKVKSSFSYSKFCNFGADGSSWVKIPALLNRKSFFSTLGTTFSFHEMDKNSDFYKRYLDLFHPPLNRNRNRSSSGGHHRQDNSFSPDDDYAQRKNNYPIKLGNASQYLPQIDGLVCSTTQCTIKQLDDFLINNQVEEAVKLLIELEKKQGIYVDLPRYLQLILACGEEGTLPFAKDVHNNLIRSKIPIDINTYNKILDMYSDCGSMSDAYHVFENSMPERNIMSWDTMIRGFAKNGLSENAIDLFTQFKEAGLKPDGQIFMGVFLACSFLCDVGEGMLHFESMSKVYSLVPTMEHYLSVVNMLGSAGYLEEAMEFIEKMPFKPSIDVWETLMNLCWVHGNIKLGCHCAGIVNCLDSSRLTDNSEKGLVPGKACDAKENMKADLFRRSICSAKYRDNYTSHPDKDKIFALLSAMNLNMKADGYVPPRCVPFKLEEEDEEEEVLFHGEKILLAAICLCSAPRVSFEMRLKNGFLCNDCHEAMKTISKHTGRKITLVNGKVHIFEDGLCTCKDHWV